MDFVKISAEGISYINLNAVACAMAFIGTTIFIIKGVSRLWKTK